MTAGGSSIPEVRRLLAVLAAGKRVAEVGTAFGLGAQALASTAREVVTVEVDPERARVAREALAGLPNVEALEGDWSPERIVVLEFESVARAKEWWASAEYAPAKALRQQSATTRMIVVEGV